MKRSYLIVATLAVVVILVMTSMFVLFGGNDDQGETYDIALVASTGDGTVTLNWQPSIDVSPVGYTLLWGTSAEDLANSLTMGNATSYELTGLSNNMTYYFRITSGDGDGLLRSAIISALPVREIVENLVIGTTSKIENTNILDSGYTYFRGPMVHESLVKQDEDGNFIPCLAESWNTTDSIVWTFHLVHNASWSDGVPVTAEDMKFTFEYLPSVDSSMATQWKMIQNVDAVDDYTVQVTLKKAYSNFLVQLMVMRSLPKHIYANITDPASFSNLNASIGTGPYMLESFDKAAGILTFKANPYYYRGAPTVQSITVRLFKNVDTMVMALQQGEIDTTYIYAKGVSYYYVSSILNSGKDVINIPNLGVPNTLWMNNARYPYSNQTFRLAVSSCFNYNELQQIMTAGWGSVANSGYLPNGTFGFKETTALTQNITKAKALLASAGFADIDDDGWLELPNGSEFSPYIITRSDGSDYARAAELVQNYMNAVGLDVRVKVQDANSVNSMLSSSKNFDMIITGTTAWGMLMWQSYATGYFDNRSMGWSMVSDAEFHDLVDELQAESDSAQKLVLIGEIQDYYASEMPSIPLYWNNIIQPYNPEYEGWAMDPMYGIMSYGTFFGLTRA